MLASLVCMQVRSDGLSVGQYKSGHCLKPDRSYPARISHRFWATTELGLDSYKRGSNRFDPNEGALDSVVSTRYSKRGSTRCDPHDVALDLVSTRYSNEGTLDFDETRYQTLDFNEILVSLEQTLDFDKSSLGPGSLVGNKENFYSPLRSLVPG